ncbi:PfkB family carbohydrate kinase [Halocalculus aciditolerans]|uniref:Carbohydrate kinase PfkB domain-containing protein n=1 Tax=Halocalculus aciditolerans TaxID=1383812 RepID=A0A830FBE2_9EURY|nr:PfkB family carbohydrate kinase [Halocalculus aciditolerans]GGL58276.1 hypothetical protein GCM10009039_15640 [Halocalculus aciditolerans]
MNTEPLDAAGLADRLAGGLDASVTALPDGSVDRRFGVEDADGTVESGEAFGTRIAEGTGKSFRVDHRTTDPGGQSVNAARQTHALGAPTTLFGHLDAAVFDTLAFETHSFGSPADVQVLEFSDTAVMLTEESSDIQRWSLGEALDRAPALADALSADAVVFGNWASLPDGSASVRALAGRVDGTLVVDPGDVTICDTEEVPEFLDALAAVDGETVLSVNENERAFLADGVAAADDAAGGTRKGARPDERADALAAIRERAGLDAAVEHGTDAAIAVTEDGVTAVENPRVERVERYVGGGDRFSGALAAALGAGWSSTDALALGNVCATHYVGSGQTGSADELRTHLREQT